MTTEELVKALRDDQRTQEWAECPGWANRSEKAASTIERQAEAIKMLREALFAAQAPVSYAAVNHTSYVAAYRAVNEALAQTKEFGE